MQIDKENNKESSDEDYEESYQDIDDPQVEGEIYQETTEIYDEIVKEFSVGEEKYTDSGFMANKKILGTKNAKIVHKWERLSAEEPLFTEESKFNPQDIQPSSLTGPYLANAFSMLQEKDIRAIFETKQSNYCGAFIVKFLIEGKLVHVIVDDQFPVKEDGTWACMSGNGKDHWMMVLEKAYAKLFGGYDKIAKGSILFLCF